MPYTFTLTTTIPASPEEIYQAWLDSLAHSEMTGGAANMSEQLGAEVSAWDGYIRGRNLELVPGARIVQSWRTSEFADEHGDSVITILLEEADEGTLLTLEHSNVPDEQRSYEEAGWQENYFEPQRRRRKLRPKLRPNVQPRLRATPSAQPAQNQSAPRLGQRPRQASAKARVGGRPAARLPRCPRANASSRLSASPAAANGAS
jgi:uncharacterized protein YndB with AHSA1/START domain